MRTRWSLTSNVVGAADERLHERNAGPGADLGPLRPHRFANARALADLDADAVVAVVVLARGRGSGLDVVVLVRPVDVFDRREHYAPRLAVVISWRWSSWNSSIKQGQQSVLWWQIEFNLTIDYRCGVKNSWWSCGHRNDYLPIYNLWIDVLESTWIQGFVPYYEFYIIEDKLMTKINGLKNIAHWHHAYSKLYGLFHLTCLGNERVRKQTRGSCHLNPPRKKAWTFFFLFEKFRLTFDDKNRYSCHHQQRHEESYGKFTSQTRIHGG